MDKLWHVHTLECKTETKVNKPQLHTTMCKTSISQVWNISQPGCTVQRMGSFKSLRSKHSGSTLANTWRKVSLNQVTFGIPRICYSQNIQATRPVTTQRPRFQEMPFKYNNHQSWSKPVPLIATETHTHTQNKQQQQKKKTQDHTSIISFLRVHFPGWLT